MFELGHPAMPELGSDVRLGRRFRFLREGVMHDRTRYFDVDEVDPVGEGGVTEDVIYREPNQVVHRVESTIRGVVLVETVSDDTDISKQYAPTPTAGDWTFFLEFGRT